MAWDRALRDGVSAIAGAVASDPSLRRACLVWLCAFAVFGLAGTAIRLIDASAGLYPALLDLFMPGREWSLPSVFGYLTALAAAVGLFACHRRSRRFAYLAWAVIMLAICLDDAFEYHEKVGGLIAAEFGIGPVLRVRGQDVGEVIAWALLGVVVLPATASALRSADPAARRVHAVFFALLGTLLVFAVGMDLAHNLGPRAMGHVFGLVEDGGEIAVLGLMAGAAWAFLSGERGAPLHAALRSRVEAGAALSADDVDFDAEALTADNKRTSLREATPSA